MIFSLGDARQRSKLRHALASSTASMNLDCSVDVLVGLILLGQRIDIGVDSVDSEVQQGRRN